MKKKHKEHLLRLWKMRQIQEGHDVSGVKSLEEAERFFDNNAEAPEDSLKIQVMKDAPEGAIIEEVDINDMTKAELLAYAKTLDIKVDSSMKKAEIIAQIEGK